MDGLDPAIHVFFADTIARRDTRNKSGHDEG